MVPKQEGASRMNWEPDICTLLILCIKEMTSENLLSSTGNSIQGSVVI